MSAPSDGQRTVERHQVAATAREEVGRGVRSLVARSSQRLAPLIPLLVMALVVLVTYLRIVWLLPRGFDWTDESFIMSMTASDRIAVGEPWGFQHLLNPLYRLTGESVLAFRVLRLVGYVAVSAAVVLLASAALHRIGVTIGRAGWALVVVFSQVGTFIAWSYPPRYLSHNELASWFSQVGVALILLSLAWGTSHADRRSAKAMWTIWLTLGATTTVLVFAKVTSGVAFAAVLAVVLLVPNNQLRLWQRVVGAAGGGGGALLLLWLLGAPIGPFFRNVIAVATDGSAQAAFGHPLSALVPYYIDSMLTTWNVVLTALVLFTLSMAPLLRRVQMDPSRTRLGGWDRLVWIFAALLAVTLVALPRADPWLYAGYLAVFMGAAALIGFALACGDDDAMSGSGFRRVATVVVAGGALVSAPVIASVGTNVALAGHFMFSATLWATALGIALVLLGEGARRLGTPARAVPALIALVLVLLATAGVEKSARQPYRMEALESQQTPTSVPELRGLLLTESEAEWIDWVAEAGESLGADGVPAIAISSPGALYAFNHSGYANPWTDAMWPASFSALQVACAEPPPDLFVLQPGTSNPDDPSTVGTVASLAACGINFPNDFEMVDEYRSTEPERAMAIWRLDTAS